MTTMIQSRTTAIRIAFLSFLLASILSHAHGACRGQKTYFVKMLFQWSVESDAGFPTTDPALLPGFLGFFCVSHNLSYSLWHSNKLLSEPMTSYIRKGREIEAVVKLKDEVTLFAGTIVRDFNFSSEFVPPIESVNSNIILDSRNGTTYISCVSRIYPSLDWFVGIYDINMCNTTTNKWIDFEDKLFAHDGGLFNTNDYTVENDIPKQDPLLPVQRVRNVAPNGFGTIFVNHSTGADAADSAPTSCFPATETVTLSSGAEIPMRDLQPGQHVLVPGTRNATITTSQVFAFSHRDPHVISPFVVLTFTPPRGALRHSLRLSEGHFLYVYRKHASHHSVQLAAPPAPSLLPACEVRLGDMLVAPHGEPMPVVAVGHSVAQGLYNPHSLHGDLIVSGVRVSCYTAAVRPASAKALLTPLRWLHRMRLPYIAHATVRDLSSRGWMRRLVQLVLGASTRNG